MRDIEFRGKPKHFTNHDKQKVEWVYGDLKHCVSTSDGQVVIWVNDRAVIPETVGEYTGLTLGKTKVYEGDIILCHSAGRKPDKYRYLVLWEDAGFFTRIITPEGLSPGSWNLWEVKAYVNRKVIGNIHDNPELLEANNS